MRPGSWGDGVIHKALSLAWGMRIMILKALTMLEECFRHKTPIRGVEFVLVYNEVNHYMGAGK